MKPATHLSTCSEVTGVACTGAASLRTLCWLSTPTFCSSPASQRGAHQQSMHEGNSMLQPLHLSLASRGSFNAPNMSMGPACMRPWLL